MATRTTPTTASGLTTAYSGELALPYPSPTLPALLFGYGIVVVARIPGEYLPRFVSVAAVPPLLLLMCERKQPVFTLDAPSPTHPSVGVTGPETKTVL